MSLEYKVALVKRQPMFFLAWCVRRMKCVVRMKYDVIIHCIFAAPKKILLLFPEYDL
mgnify:CR=1 FL=1